MAESWPFSQFKLQILQDYHLIIFLAYYLDEIKARIKNLYDGFLPCIIVIGIMMAFIVIQPDFSTAFMIGLIGIILLFISWSKNISYIDFIFW